MIAAIGSQGPAHLANTSTTELEIQYLSDRDLSSVLPIGRQLLEAKIDLGQFSLLLSFLICFVLSLTRGWFDSGSKFDRSSRFALRVIYLV